MNNVHRKEQMQTKLKANKGRESSPPLFNVLSRSGQGIGLHGNDGWWISLKLVTGTASR